MNDPRSRTNEFRSVYASAQARSGPSSSAGGGAGKAKASAKGTNSKSDVARLAGGIARDIQATTEKLQKLAQLAKRKTLFDDRPVEISELTYIIKQDISDLNTQIASLQQITRAASDASKSGSGRKKEAKQVEEHNSNVVMLLQSKLAEMGIGFKDVLEIRTQNMKASKDRTEQFMFTTSASASGMPAPNRASPSSPAPPSSPSAAPGATTSGPRLRRPPPTNSSSAAATVSHADYYSGPRYDRPESILNAPPPARGPSPYAPSPGATGGRPSLDGGFAFDRKGKGRGDYLALDLEDAEGGRAGPGGGGGAQGMQMQMMEEQDNYIQSRSTAIETIESTIAELGGIFSQLAHMVAEQRETVQRIDADTTDIQNNVQGAQRELLKYYASVSSNRWLMLKIFGVMIIFFLLFILVT